MKYLLVVLLFVTQSALANIEIISDSVVQVNYDDAVIATGKDYLEIMDPAWPRLHDVYSYNTDTQEIIHTSEITLAGVTVGAGPGDAYLNGGNPDPICDPYEGTSKREVIGLLDRWNNLYASDASKKTVFNNIGNMFDDVDSLKIRIQAMKKLVNGCEITK